jgi:glycine dehydrogenase
MVEPTESESKAELDRFIDAMVAIKQEIDEVAAGKVKLEDSALYNSPFTIDMVTKQEWKFPFTREKAAFPLKFVKDNKYWPASGRVDNAYGDKNIMCSCPPMETFN